ncbi:hypothetical protein [Adhaeribacter pallidiroseus]|uniref:hypothetical protein n=1 Tax=Adhaeribacter pallidiroseus TaxID=2072847 RepID=UPI0011C01D8E|nr:hypothetical protein [Adhaeribacter pallidiroseus]
MTIPVVKERFKKELTEVRTDESGWIKYYYDKATEKEWVEYYPYQEDRAPSILKRTDLPTELESLMNTCFSSDEVEDWRGLGAELSSKEYGISKIAKVLKANAQKWSGEALSEFKKSFRPIDNRNIIGMKMDEVEKSYREFVDSKKEIDNIIK